MMNWLSKNAKSVEAIAAVITACMAIAAFIGIRYQLESADEIQRAQSARDAFRAHLALSVEHPAFTLPNNPCGLLSSPKAGAYTAFVDHLLYSAEQTLDLEPDWKPTFKEELEPHKTYLCSADGPSGDTPRMKELLGEFEAEMCKNTEICEPAE